MRCLVVFLIALTGCASAPKYLVSASAPARIEVDGITVCSETPCIIEGESAQRGGCEWALPTNMEAFPINKTDGYTQRKKVVGQCGKEEAVFFDMKSRGGVSTSADTN